MILTYNKNETKRMHLEFSTILKFEIVKKGEHVRQQAKGEPSLGL